MSAEQIESQVLSLSESERRQFIHWVDDHRHEILQNEDEINDEMRREILHRSSELRQSPALAEPVDGEYFERTKRRVVDARTRQASFV